MRTFTSYYSTKHIFMANGHLGEIIRKDKAVYIEHILENQI